MNNTLTETLTASLMAQLFDVTSDAIIVIDAAQHIVRFNRGAEKIFGYCANEVIGLSLDTLLPERFAHAHQTHVQQFGAGADSAREMGERRAISGRRKDGGEFPAAAGISKLEQDGQQLFAVILRDVTEQRRLEAEARAQSTQTAIAAERNRLARDLHDAVTQSLFSASLMAEVLPKLWESDREKGLAQLQDIRQLTRSALAEMRTLLLELRPTAIMEGKLSELLAQLAEATCCRSGMNVTVNADEQRHLPGDVQVAFYRIAQEALHNISKHSRAKQANVQLSLLPRNAMLLIHDNGLGFEYTGIGATHLGLRIMHERAEEVGATVQIESGLGQGTDVLVNWSER
jgi:PAS domain S-box-containing protein